MHHRHRSLARRSLAGAAALGVLLAVGSTAPAQARNTDRDGDGGTGRRAVQVDLEVKGNGHGIGMSQYGAEGAAREGRSYRQILDFYYPGTSVQHLGGTIDVLVSADDDGDTRVLAADGLEARVVGSKRSWNLTRADRQAQQWRVRADGRGRSVIQSKRSGGWRTFHRVGKDVELAGPKVLTLVTPDGRTDYRGTLRNASTDPGDGGTGGTERVTVSHVSLEAYLRGVVPKEVFPSWHADALRAQAVAARTYAAYERDEPLSRAYDLCDTTRCQVYGGASAEVSTTDAAIRDTRKEVLTSGGEPAFTQFSASNGGWTVQGPFDYLPAQEDPYDGWSGNPYVERTLSLSSDTIEKAWPGMGAYQSLEVLERDGNGAWGGRVTRLTVHFAGGDISVGGDTFRSYVGLPSTWFRDPSA